MDRDRRWRRRLRSRTWGNRGIARRFTGIVADLGLKLDLQPVLEEVRTRIEGGANADYAASRGEAIHGRVVAALREAE